MAMGFQVERFLRNVMFSSTLIASAIFFVSMKFMSKKTVP